MSDAKTTTFKDMLKQQQVWTDYAVFCSQVPDIIKKDVENNASNEDKLVNDLKNHQTFKNMIIKDTKPMLSDAEKLLTAGRVAAVDGTMAKYPMLSGTRCQIGIVAVNYQGEKIRRSFFISHASLHEEPDDVISRIQRRNESDDELSSMHLRGLMMYREREAGMDEKFDGKYILYHGPLLPFELMSGLGRLRALDTTLDLLRRVVRAKQVMSIISSSSFKDFLYFGLALEKGQYLTHPSYTLEYHLTNTSDFLRWSGKWRDEERAEVEEFIRDYASQICIGVIRIGDRPYVFHAHRDIFDQAAGIIARDSMFQREKGFPLLVDYADTLASEYFSNAQFARMVEWELSKTKTYLKESSERRMRVK